MGGKPAAQMGNVTKDGCLIVQGFIPMFLFSLPLPPLAWPNNRIAEDAHYLYRHDRYGRLTEKTDRIPEGVSRKGSSACMTNAHTATATITSTGWCITSAPGITKPGRKDVISTTRWAGASENRSAGGNGNILTMSRWPCHAGRLSPGTAGTVTGW